MAAKNVPYVLAVMATAGLYDDIGQVAVPHRAAGQERRRRRASSPWRPASSASPWSRRRSTTPGTACGRRRPFARSSRAWTPTRTRSRPSNGSPGSPWSRGSPVRLTRHDGVPVVQRSRSSALPPGVPDALQARRVGDLVPVPHSPSYRRAGRCVSDRGSRAARDGPGRSRTGPSRYGHGQGLDLPDQHRRGVPTSEGFRPHSHKAVKPQHQLLWPVPIHEPDARHADVHRPPGAGARRQGAQ